MAVASKCEICTVEASKYKCPQCSIRYCSLGCFRSEAHSHASLPEPAPTAPAVAEAPAVTEAPTVPTGIDCLLQDKQIQRMLKFPALKTHLAIVVAIMTDPTLTNEQTTEGRREIANKKLCQLRVGGAEENSLVEEFCQRVMELML